MSTSSAALPTAEAITVHDLIHATAPAIASLPLLRTSGGTATLFAFDVCQALKEHTSPFEALLFVLEGRLTVTIGGAPVPAVAGTVVRLPISVPHAVQAEAPARMLLVILR